MVVTDEQLAAQVEAVAAQLRTLADGLANDGFLTASGMVLGAVQTIRMLYTRLYPSPVPPPEAPAPEGVVEAVP